MCHLPRVTHLDKNVRIPNGRGAGPQEFVWFELKMNKLENENNYLKNVIDRFKDTIHIFVHWVCKKFDLGAEDYLIRDFQKENHILLDAEKQIQKEEKEKEWDLER